MGDTYKKSKGNAGLDGVQFQLNLVTVFLLNALRTQKNWKISTENKEAGKFDDLVLDLDDKSVLLQAKFKQNKKITRDQIFSCNSRNADFSLPKYFFSYMEVKSESKEKTVIVCTNTSIDEEDLKNVLTGHCVDSDNMLYYEGATCPFFTFNENILPDLKASAEIYLENNLRDKGIDKIVITDKNMKDFLKHLQFFSNYPSGNKLDQVITQLLAQLNISSLYQGVSSLEIYKKVEDWFKQPKGEYLTEIRAKAIFSEIKSDQYCETLKNYNVSFRHDNLDFTDSKRIFQVNYQGGYLLQALKIHGVLQRNDFKKLYVSPNTDMEVQKQIIEAFELPRYTFLVIIDSKVAEKEICFKLRNVLEKFKYKKLILVTKSNNKLCQQIGSNNICHLDGSVMFQDLSIESQLWLMREKSIIFQGEKTSVEELLATQSCADWAKAVNSEILEKLVAKTDIKVGARVLDSDERISCYYVYRTFQRKLCKIQDEKSNNELEELQQAMTPLTLDGESSSQKRDETFSEDNIYDVDEDVILIADSAGTGKSTVLTKLAINIKEKHPYLWVIKIELTEYTSILRDLLNNHKDTISVMELLNIKKDAKFTNHLEEFVFFMNKKVVLMIDGIDEISPDYTKLILNLLTQCRQATNFAKIILTTRPHMVPELEDVLKVKPFMLQPFTEQNQVDFLTSYWTYNLDIDHDNKERCQQYARSVIKRIFSWTKSYHDKENDFAAIPLQLRMIAEIFKESIKLNQSSDWEGCKEYLQGTSIEPQLPEKIKIKKLYDMFIEKKRDIYIGKGNPSGNSAANKALSDQFDECLIYHRILALKVILSKNDFPLFSFYGKCHKNMEIDALKIGIVQKFNDDLNFIHITFAEYFTAENLANELLLHPNVKLQELFVEKILQMPKYKIVRTFLDNFLHNFIYYIPLNTFEDYQSSMHYPNYWRNKTNIIHLLAEEGCVSLLLLLFNCIDFKIITDKEINISDLQNRISIKETKVLQTFARKIGIKRRKSTNALNTMQILVQEAGVNIKDELGWAPLHYAANSGHFDMVQFLVEHGAKIDSLNKEGHTPLNLAAAIGQSDIVKYLVDLGANVSISNCTGRTSLHSAAKSTRVDTVKYLVKAGGDANIEDKTGHTALYFAVAGGQLDIVEYLVNSNHDVKVCDNNGRTPLHFAAAKDQLAIVECLVKFSDDINIRDHRGRSALHFAAAENQFDNVVFLLKSGSDVNARDKDGRTALHFSAMWNHLATMENLMNTGVELTTLRSNNVDLVEHLVKSGTDVNIKDKNGSTALHLAVKWSKFSTVEYLVKAGSDVNIRDNDGYTALHVAALCDKSEIVEYLIQSDVDVDIVDNQGRTAYQVAVEEKQLNTVKCFEDTSFKGKTRSMTL